MLAVTAVWSIGEEHQQHELELDTKLGLYEGTGRFG